VATPFVQGRLRKQELSVTIETECAQSERSLHIVVDSQMRCRIEEAGAEPLVFEPQVDWKAFEEPNIIHAY
jgi:hypothetical protein